MVSKGIQANCIPASQMSKIPSANYASAPRANSSSSPARQDRVENTECSKGSAIVVPAQVYRPDSVTSHSNTFRGRSFSMASASNLTTPSHCQSDSQRRLTADFCNGGDSPVIGVRMSKIKPDLPQRGVSLLHNRVTPHSPSKRHSCPSSGFVCPLAHTASSSSPTPPTIPSYVIMGPSPLGVRMRPKPSTSAPRARTARLSLQVPFSVTIPELEPKSAPESHPTTHNSNQCLNLDSTSKTDHTHSHVLRPHRRHHSDSSAFLACLAAPFPAVTLEELGAVQLRPVVCFDGSDDVFQETEEQQQQQPQKILVSPKGHNAPPPIAAKTSLTRRLARHIAQSLSAQASPPATATATAAAGQGEAIYSRVRRTKATLTDHSTGDATKPGKKQGRSTTSHLPG